MKQMLIWFAIVYGNINALVLSVVGALLWLNSDAGGPYCDSLNFSPIACKAAAVGAILLVFGTSTFLSCLRLIRVRKQVRQKDPSDQT